MTGKITCAVGSGLIDGAIFTSDGGDQPVLGIRKR